MTAGDTKFSLAMSSSPSDCRRISHSTAAATSGSPCRSASPGGRWSHSNQRITSLLGRVIQLDLLDAPRMTAALEGRLQPRLENLLGVVVRQQARGKHEYVRVVVLSRELGNLRIPHPRRADVRIPVRHVRHPEPRPTQQHPTLRLTLR